MKLRMVDEGPGGGGGELVGANVARRRRPAHAGREPQRRRAVHDANIGPCGRGVVPGGSKELKLRMVDEGPGGGGCAELVGVNVVWRRRPAHGDESPSGVEQCTTQTSALAGAVYFHRPSRSRWSSWNVARFEELSFRSAMTMLRARREKGESSEMCECERSRAGIGEGRSNGSLPRSSINFVSLLDGHCCF